MRKFTKIIAAMAGTVALVGGLAACSTDGADNNNGSDGNGDSAELTKVRVQLGWYAQAQHGGWFTADVEGYFEDEGIDIEILPGGPQVSGLQLLAAGQVDVATSIPEEVIRGAERGIPLVAVAADMDQSPLGVMFKEETGWSDWSDLNGRTWIVSDWNPGWKVTAANEGIEFSTQTSTGNVAVFLAKDDYVQEGYYTSDLYSAEKAGANVDFLPYSDAGFDPYGAVLVMTQDFVDENPDTVKHILAAVERGWQTYMTDVDAAQRANEAIMASNPEIDEPSLWYEWDVQRELFIGDRAGQPMGTMTADRWQHIIDALKSIGDIEGNVDPNTLFTNDYLSSDITTPSADDLPAAPDGSYEGQE